jgi:hypothetical protein
MARACDERVRWDSTSLSVAGCIERVKTSFGSLRKKGMHPDHKSSVVDVINRYAFAVDTQRWELFDQIFTADVEADFGPGIHWRDLVSLKRDFIAIHSPFKSTQHVTTNHVIDVKGDTAHCVSYVHGHFFREVPGGNMFESGGWYDDRLALTDAGWRISHRTCRMTWWGGNPKVLETMQGVKVEHALNSLREEAEGGRILFLKG